MRRVPLVRRNLLADWRRLVISVLGVGIDPWVAGD
jgi:hypothetical protein